ncbi:MAG: DNA-protecting protein DprA [Nitrospira sp.]|nr:DNA-protecting protein DprA [bacterium]MBL7049479.1 DNA-protecting protein DprA [Nitrospira sp.]
MSDLRYMLALNFLPELGPVLISRLLAAFGTPEGVFNASYTELTRVDGIGKTRALAVAGFNNWDRIQREMDIASANNIQILHINAPEYPESLRRIHAAPLILYIRGRLQADDKYAVAMVGSRRASAYGMNLAEKMAVKLASSGLTVVSGMARGIDTACHRGALKGGRTIAVLGSGLDVPYPASNVGLMKNIMKSGAVISEFPFGTSPLRENFPRRNRIISALSLGVIVVEAALDSGSLITVRYALEQNKDVFAVPGNVNSVNAKGTNDLIKKGARLVESADEVIDELGSQLRGLMKCDVQALKRKLPELSAEETAIFSFINEEPKHIDTLVRASEINISKALSLLMSLELKGAIRQTDGKCFMLN